MKKIITTLIVVLLSACSAQKPTLTRYSDISTTSGFDTSMTLIAYAKNEKEFEEYFSQMKSLFWSYHILFDKYNNYEDINNIKTINDNAGIRPVQVDPIIIDLLKEAQKYTEISDYFDVTYGAVYSIWHEYREQGMSLNQEGKEGPIPSIEELQDAKLKTGWENIELDEINNTVYLSLKGMQLDIGAIAKGYATEKVALALEESGLHYGIVSGGGNIRTINNKPDETPWVIGIQEPTLSLNAPSIDSFEINSSMSVVTSGDYQRAYIGPDEKLYSHLINPHTLLPETHFRSISIITKNSTMADAISTSLFMMEYEEAQKFIKSYNQSYPENKISVVWVVDEDPSWIQGENYDYTMTQDLFEISTNMKKKDH